MYVYYSAWSISVIVVAAVVDYTNTWLYNWFPIQKIKHKMNKLQVLLARIDQVYFISIWIWICVRRSLNAYNIIVPSLCWV